MKERGAQKAPLSLFRLVSYTNTLNPRSLSLALCTKVDDRRFTSCKGLLLQQVTSLASFIFSLPRLISPRYLKNRTRAALLVLQARSCPNQDDSADFLRGD